MWEQCPREKSHCSQPSRIVVPTEAAQRRSGGTCSSCRVPHISMLRCGSIAPMVHTPNPRTTPSSGPFRIRARLQPCHKAPMEDRASAPATPRRDTQSPTPRHSEADGRRIPATLQQQQPSTVSPIMSIRHDTESGAHCEVRIDSVKPTSRLHESDGSHRALGVFAVDFHLVIRTVYPQPNSSWRLNAIRCSSRNHISHSPKGNSENF